MPTSGPIGILRFHSVDARRDVRGRDARQHAGHAAPPQLLGAERRRRVVRGELFYDAEDLWGWVPRAFPNVPSLLRPSPPAAGISASWPRRHRNPPLGIIHVAPRGGAATRPRRVPQRVPSKLRRKFRGRFAARPSDQRLLEPKVAAGRRRRRARGTLFEIGHGARRPRPRRRFDAVARRRRAGPRRPRPLLLGRRADGHDGLRGRHGQNVRGRGLGVLEVAIRARRVPVRQHVAQHLAAVERVRRLLALARR